VLCLIIVAEEESFLAGTKAVLSGRQWQSEAEKERRKANALKDPHEETEETKSVVLIEVTTVWTAII